MQTKQSGLSTIAITFIILSVLVVGGVVYYRQVYTSRIAQAPATASPSPSQSGLTTVVPARQDRAQNTGTYNGTRLAGDTSPLLDFTAADYQRALASDRLLVLYFYADWCPICRAEFPLMEAAFNELSSDEAIGFRVNFNDAATDEAEKALAREHGVAYQHTKVFVKNGQRVLKSPETWERERYLTEIRNAGR